MYIRKKTYRLLNNIDNDNWGRIIAYFLQILILSNVIAIIIGSIREVQESFGQLLYQFEVVSVTFFSIEYVLRLWSIVENPIYKKPLLGRIRFMFTALAMIDLLAILPFYLPFLGLDLRFLRILRIFRVLRLLKLARYVEALSMFSRIFKAKKDHLITSLIVFVIMMITIGSLMYYAERDASPEIFPNIPMAIVWAFFTLTGKFSDFVPSTIMGWWVAALTSLLAIGVLSFIYGLLISGFLDEMKKIKRKKNKKIRTRSTSEGNTPDRPHEL